MGKCCLIFIFSYINILSNFYCYGQEIHYDLVETPKNEPWGRVSGMVQDPQGFLWIGTNAGGLYRYDGHHFTAYHHDRLNPNSLGNEWIESIYGSSKDEFLLLGTFGFGVDRFDLATGNFTHYRYNPKDTTTISNDTVTSIIKDRKGMFWIGTHNGLNKWNPQTGKFVRFKNDPKDSSSLSDNQVRVLYLDSEGIVWVGTKSVWSHDGGSRFGGLNRYDSNTGKFTRYMHDPNDSQSLIDNQITALFEDSKGNFWVGTAWDGLHTMDRERGTFTRHLNDPYHPEKPSRPPLNDFSNVVTPSIVFIREDSRGKIWIGTFDNGINVYDPATRKTIYFGSSALDSGKKFKDTNFSTAFATPDGAFWVASWGDFLAPRSNLYKININNEALAYTIMGKRIYNFYEDLTGVLWIATSQGLYKKTGDGTIQQFLIDKNASSLNNVIVDIKEDKSHNLWIATLHNGLYQFNPITQTFSGYHHEAGKDETLNSDSIYSLELASDDKLWIGTWKGLDELDISSGKFRHYLHDSKDSTSIGGGSFGDEGGMIVADIFISKDNDIWVCVGRNVNKLNQKTGQFKKYRLADFSYAYNITEDSNGNLWIGDGDGLFMYNKEEDVFKPFYDSTGVINRVTAVFNITEDLHKNLWLKTPKKFIKLNVQKKEANVYEIRGHEYDNFLFNSYITHKGEILSGEAAGYLAFYPDSLLKDTHPPTISITGFSISGQKIDFGKSPLLPEPVYQIEDLKLKHYQNTFSFELTSIDFTGNEEDRHLVYMLENYDLKWRKVDSEGTAGYYNVHPGKYVFRVKTMNNFGLWAHKEISVIIYPPWWRTLWAYAFYLLFLLVGVISIDRYQRKRLIQKEREKARERELEQAHEIEKAYFTLKQTQAQLIQSEKLASLGQLTAGIAHEIQNPLNFVNNFSEVSSELILEIQEARAKKQDASLKIQEPRAENQKSTDGEELEDEILEDIKQNLEKINHHGKRADAIVKGMLEHSRASSGEKVPTDINALADEYLRLSYHGMRAKDKNFQAHFETHFDPDLPKVNVVPQDIGRVLLNIINNAFQACMEQGKRESKIGTGAQDDPNPYTPIPYSPLVKVSTKNLGDKIEISISDNGPGITDSIKEKIFQPFFTTKPTGQGTGLGLSLSYDIVKAHGGEIWVGAKDDNLTNLGGTEGDNPARRVGGSVFVVQLPK